MEMGTIWDASKAFFGGLAIRQNAIRNAKNNKRIKELLQKLKREEKAAFQMPSGIKQK